MSPAVLDRPGKPTFAVAEEFTLDQFLREGGHVDAVERPARPGRAAVDLPGDQALSGAALARDEDRAGRGRGHPIDPFLEAVQHGGGRQEVLMDLALQHVPLPRSLTDLEASPQLGCDFRMPRGLPQVVERPGLECRRLGLRRGMIGRHDDLQVRMPQADLAEYLQTVAAPQHQVEDHDVGRTPGDGAQSLLSALRGAAVEVLRQDRRKVRGELGIVVDDEDAGLVACHGCGFLLPGLQAPGRLSIARPSIHRLAVLRVSILPRRSAASPRTPSPHPATTKATGSRRPDDAAGAAHREARARAGRDR